MYGGEVRWGEVFLFFRRINRCVRDVQEYKRQKFTTETNKNNCG